MDEFKDNVFKGVGGEAGWFCDGEFDSKVIERFRASGISVVWENQEVHTSIDCTPPPRPPPLSSPQFSNLKL